MKKTLLLIALLASAGFSQTLPNVGTRILDSLARYGADTSADSTWTFKNVNIHSGNAVFQTLSATTVYFNDTAVDITDSVNRILAAGNVPYVNADSSLFNNLKISGSGPFIATRLTPDSVVIVVPTLFNGTVAVRDSGNLTVDGDTVATVNNLRDFVQSGDEDAAFHDVAVSNALSADGLISLGDVGGGDYALVVNPNDIIVTKLELIAEDTIRSQAGLVLENLTSKGCLGTDASGNVIEGSCPDSDSSWSEITVTDTAFINYGLFNGIGVSGSGPFTAFEFKGDTGSAVVPFAFTNNLYSNGASKFGDLGGGDYVLEIGLSDPSFDVNSAVANLNGGANMGEIGPGVYLASIGGGAFTVDASITPDFYGGLNVHSLFRQGDPGDSKNPLYIDNVGSNIHAIAGFVGGGNSDYDDTLTYGFESVAGPGGPGLGVIRIFASLFDQPDHPAEINIQPVQTDAAIGSVVINGATVTVTPLAGSGNRYVCADSGGVLFTSAIACP